MIDRWAYEGETCDNNVEYEATYEYGFISTQLKRIAGKADFKYWLGFRIWTPEQTACLIYEANPENYHLIADNPKINEFKLLAESKGNMTPYEWKLFAMENQLYIPKPILDIEPSTQGFTPEQQPEAAVIGGVNAKTESARTRLQSIAREIGEQWMKAERKDGRDPGGNKIAQHVEAELKKRDERGPRGDYWDWQTIKKEALKGITGKPPKGKTQKFIID